jgi:hypothetical protein
MVDTVLRHRANDEAGHFSSFPGTNHELRRRRAPDRPTKTPSAPEWGNGVWLRDC